MKLQRKPNRWSCIATAFAMALDIPVAEVFRIVGHDGSEVVFPELPEPIGRRGLHLQECLDVCRQRGFAATPVELFPMIRPTLMPGHKPGPDVVVRFGQTDDANWQRFTQLIRTTSGVIEGIGRRSMHAVAYRQGQIFDPEGDQYDYSRTACEERDFFTRTAWRIDCLAN